MSFTLLMCVFVAAVMFVVFAILDRLPFPPMVIWGAKMVVLLVSGLSILLTIGQLG